MASQDDMQPEGPTLDDYEVVEDEGEELAGSQANLGDAEEEEGEELIGENMMQDYRSMEHLDDYEREGLDEEFTEEMGYEERQAARLAAERAMAERDETGGRRRRRVEALEELEDGDFLADARRRRLATQGDGGEGGEDGEAAAPDELDQHLERMQGGGRVSEWLALEPVQRAVRRRFSRFLRTFTDERGERVYVQRMAAMVMVNGRSLEVDFHHLIQVEQCNAVAIWVADAPRLVLDLMNEAARDVVLSTYEKYGAIQSEILVRLTNLPIDDKIRDLRTWHIGCLVKVRGVVTRRSGVFPQLRLVRYDCASCGYVMGPFAQTSDKEVKPHACAQCQSRGPFNINAAETVYQNYQKLTLQESPGSVPAGRLPRHKEVVLLHDLIDCARPGEEVEVTGIYTCGYDALLNARQGFPVFQTHIEAVYVAKSADLFSVYKLTDEDRGQIAALASDPRIGARVVASIAPSIYGHESIKLALALALFGGVEKHPTNSHRLRGDINVLLLGDPGTAKSQFLKYAESTATRAVYTTGKGASAVGLTASVHKDAITKEWTLEGGALVLADKGVCLIDEFDKMNDQDRVSIHEAMEQQTISISKAGIVTQLQARCSVIAAANPVQGRYDASRTFSENVELTDPILSRFDVLCVVRDVVDPVQDARLAHFVVGSHAASHPDAEGDADAAAGAAAAEAAGAGGAGAGAPADAIPQDMLRKYITYAKQHCRPQINQGEYDGLLRVYAELRREAAASHGMPIAVRHLESMIRMAEAHARMHLREFVGPQDVQAAIKVMVDSFISTQKLSLQRELRRRLRAYIVLPSDYFPVLLHLLQDLVRSEKRSLQLVGEYEEGAGVGVACRALEDRAREYSLSVSDLPSFYASRVFRDAGFALDEGAGRIVLPDA